MNMQNIQNMNSRFDNHHILNSAWKFKLQKKYLIIEQKCQEGTHLDHTVRGSQNGKLILLHFQIRL